MVTVFGSIAVGIMLVAYMLEPRSKWYVLLFAFASAATSFYSGIVEVYPITVIEALWSIVAFQRFITRFNTNARHLRR